MFLGKPHYGSHTAPGSTLALHHQEKRRRMNPVAIFANIVMPWLLFTALYAVVSGPLRYRHPTCALGLVLCGLAIAFITGALAYRTKVKERDPAWYTFAALSFLLAVLLAVIFGDLNFWYNMAPFFDMEVLNTYPSVDPAREKGQQLMDAGRVYFADGVSLDMKKAMSFKNLDLYCVCPIVHGYQQLASYDFWAVGVNCCSGLFTDFRCGEYNNPNARAGLRLLRDDQRPLFKLAVSQAEEAYNIKAENPLFFYWMQDPIAEVNTYRDDGWKYFIIGVVTHFAFNLFFVVSAGVAFSKRFRY